jgi:hypothetical protein
MAQMHGTGYEGWLAAYRAGEPGTALDQRRPAALVSCGTLMMEFTLMRGETDILPLLHLARQDGWPRFLSLSTTAEGRIALIQRQGNAFHALSIDASDEIGAGGRMRLVWRWNGPERQSLLVLEALDQGTLRQQVGLDPLPMPREDLETLLTGTGGARIGPRVDWVALGDHLHPVGPGACFAPSTPIETPTGPRPAGAIRTGDLVETADAGAQPVLWSGRVSLPTLGALRPVRLCAPAFGKTRDLWVLPHHRLALSGSLVEYLCGEEEVLAEARHLVDGCTALQPDRPAALNWHGILLADHHLLIADGCLIESLDPGGMALRPALAANGVLTDLAAAGTLPHHAAPPRRILHEYEARTLTAMRAQARGPVAA